MRAGRLVGLVLHLQQRGPTTAETLAEALEVSVRTIYRDVATLQEAGVPLWAESGPGGGIRLVEGWSGRIGGVTADELDALTLAGAPSVAAELGLGTVVAAAQAKVVDALPPELRGRASRVRERFLLDAPGWFHRGDPDDHLPAVASAVWNDERIDLRYRRADRTVARRIDPLGLVLKGGTWYLVAAHRGQARTYRVGRISSVESTGQRVRRPDRFDLARWWEASAEEFDRSLLRTAITVRLSPAALRLLPHVVGPVAARIGTDTAGDPDPDGWRRLELPVESEEVAAGQLPALGSGVEVLAPLSLRRHLATVGAELAAQNRVGD
ncbi:MAG: helix-turn-helix transcriptional regulator [Acidimicrobiales bacterium]